MKIKGMMRLGSYKYNSLHNFMRRKVIAMMMLPLSKSYSTSQHHKYIECSDTQVNDILCEDMKVIPDFLTEQEEQSLLEEAMKSVKRLRYEFHHWDNAIHGYRETEKMTWNDLNTKIIKRVQHFAFAQEDCHLSYVHILDLAQDGFIKPHVDAVKFCGTTIAGMSLMSSSVMRLVQEVDKDKFANVHLPQRSLYIMTNRARYDFTHEVLKDEESLFNGKHVPRQRRISIVCRNEPQAEDSS